MDGDIDDGEDMDIDDEDCEAMGTEDMSVDVDECKEGMSVGDDECEARDTDI